MTHKTNQLTPEKSVQTVLDQLREMKTRNALSTDKLQELYRLERGAAGEIMVQDYLKEFGQPKWKRMSKTMLKKQKKNLDVLISYSTTPVLQATKQI